MIVPMKKVAVITQAKDAEAALEKLAVLGIVHVEHRQLPKGKSVDAIRDEIALLNQAAGILSAAEFKNKERREKEPGDGKFIARHIIDSRNRLNQLEEYSRNMRGLISDWEPWGNFDPEEINLLAKKGIYLRLLSIPARELKDLPAGLIVEKLHSAKGVLYCAVISREKTELAFKEVSPPKMPLEKMRSRLAEDLRALAQIKDELRRLSPYSGALLRAKELLQKELHFQEALAGLGQAGALAFLAGYIPFDLTDKLARAAKSEQWALSIGDPCDEDQVPTLIRNPRWVSLIAPLFKLIEVVPGYHEVDISLLFLISLSVFFGMLIGDAGYGLVFLILTFLAQKKWGEKLHDKSVFRLLYLFNFCAVIWGVLSATFFGQAWLAASVRPLVPALRDNHSLQAICFFLGALHLSIGHGWRALLKFPALSALADFGWILILWAAFFLAKTLILGEQFPFFAKWLIAAGPILVVFFTAQKKNIFRRAGIGLGQLLLNLVNSFTDVVSYIRLFAVGLATVAVADAFNQMALGIGFNSLASGFAAALVIFIGHALNIFLGPMAVLVHGVRLNVLEFCNHVDVKWSGFLYRPLAADSSANR